MKRFTALITAVLLVFLSGCGTPKQAEKKEPSFKDKYAGQFRVGFSRVGILPDDPVPLSGYGNNANRISTGYLDEIVFDAIAVSDKDNNTLLLCAYDGIGISNEAPTEDLLNAIKKATGLTEHNIVFTASHSHSSPDPDYSSMRAVQRYNAKVKKKAAEAAVQALNSRVPAKMFYGSTEARNLNFIRHYWGKKTTGEVVAYGDNHNNVGFTGTLTAHITENDPTLHIIKFEREGEKDVYFTSFRAHPKFTGVHGERKDISADWIGAFREEFEKATENSYCSYFQGAAGNMNATGYMDGETLTEDYHEYAKLLNGYAKTAAKSLTEVNTDRVAGKRITVTAEINHDGDSMVPQATAVVAWWKSHDDFSGSIKEAQKYGLYSQFHANAILRNAKMGKTGTIKATAFRIGDIGFSFVPYEQFDTNGAAIEDASPFKYTVSVAYTNGKFAYIPSNYGYEYGCYEADITRYAAGTGEKVADALIEQLKKLK